MDILKKIPITYTGELHDVRLINFSVDLNEVRPLVPASIKVRDFNGRALFSMVDVKLRNMKPSFVPSFFSFEYRHVAFRLLVDDAYLNKGQAKGIYFLQSFTDKFLIEKGGSLFTDYKLEKASIKDKGDMVEIESGGKYIKYIIGNEVISEDPKLSELHQVVGALDRAYSISGTQLRFTRIQREKWPIQSVSCSSFENTFFKTARLEAAFRVFETIYYTWLPPKAIRS
jgi:hypothetical protein